MIIHPNRIRDLGNAIVAAVTPTRVGLITEPWQSAPQFYKFPGGGVEPNETPQLGAARELWEEMGIRVNARKLILLAEEELPSTRGGSTFPRYLFGILIPEKLLDTRIAIGNEGEETHALPLDILNSREFYPHHKRLLMKSSLVVKSLVA